MKRVLAASSIVLVVALTALVPGSGRASSGAAGLPAGLSAAIHARLAAGTVCPAPTGFAITAPGFGFSVALSADGTTALVGAWAAGCGKGEAYIFHVADAGSWSSSDAPKAVLMNKPGRTSEQLFGRAVALSADGTTAFVGAPLIGAGAEGAIYVFHVASASAWKSSSKPTATIKVKRDHIGDALGLSADGMTLIAGAPWYNGPGGAYIFRASSERAWKSTSTPTAALSERRGRSGGRLPGALTRGAGRCILQDRCSTARRRMRDVPSADSASAVADESRA